MNRYIDVDKAIAAVSTYKGQRFGEDRDMYIKRVLNELPPADVVEVGKAYPRGLFEKYGLTEWKDKDGRRWVMIERRNNE